jgi:hypothetical protein
MPEPKAKVVDPVTTAAATPAASAPSPQLIVPPAASPIPVGILPTPAHGECKRCGKFKALEAGLCLFCRAQPA